MQTPAQIAAEIAQHVPAPPQAGHRQLIAIAGPPGSGKSTVAAELCDQLLAKGMRTGLVAMDGFHLDNPILEARGLRARKGAPETFDLAGFAALLRRLHTEDEVIVPRFDRALDVSVGSAQVIDRTTTTAIVEGNYLLLDAPGWRDLRAHWTFSAFLDVPMDTLTDRLMMRWRAHGLSHQDAFAKIEHNDLPNAQLVGSQSHAEDVRFAG